ncbi:lactoylglutathione lyase [Leptospira perolatii]|uniref:Lactoylglutathione lyase n=1 Tax=Leptospira perolatii TaxID=2023191 RepID=A0A2M9ZIJ8_9LEPT|nr:VOC family protein [Leptospira perolatii]PJZ69074.1 lactoylglutathione lyase [Leptospira perolatii]PJZ71783.1 lactoylglutathione lyase [Leptospira perolatii]
MNTIAYFEIQVNEPKKAVHFYEEVFGWKFYKQEGLPIEYWHIETGGIMGGLLQRPAPEPGLGQGTNAFVCSAEVSNFDSIASKIMKAGGQVALPKFAVPGKCWQGYFLDNSGNTFGIFQVDEHAK